MLKKHSILYIMFLALIIASSITTYGVTHTVKQDGSGDFTNINEAISAAWSGDTILVYPGTYYEAVNLANKDLTLTSTDPASMSVIKSTILDGSLINVSPLSFSGSESAACVVKGFTICNSLTYGIYCSGDSTIENCIIENNNDDGIYCFGADPILHNLIIQGNQDWGVYSHDSAGDPLIDCCTIVGNNGGGVYTRYAYYAIQNTIIWGNAMPQIYIYSTPYPNYCCIQDVSYTNKGTGNIYANPEFVSQQDLHLTEMSPCIDAGTNMSWMTGATDIDGNPRIRGGRVDMGAYEFVPEPTMIMLIFLFVSFVKLQLYYKNAL